MNKLLSNIGKDIKRGTWDAAKSGIKGAYNDAKSNVKDKIASANNSLAQAMPNTYKDSAMRGYFAKLSEEGAWTRKQKAKEDRENKAERGKETEARTTQQATLDTGFKNLLKQQKLTNEKLDKLVKKTGANDKGILGDIISGGATGTAVSTGAKSLSKFGGISKILGRVAAPVTGLLAGYSEYNSDENKDQSTGVKTARAVTTGGGALAGMLAGAKLGGMGGAAVGSVIPGLGTVVGGAGGMLLGGIAGGLGGEKLSKYLSHKVFSSKDTSEQTPTESPTPTGMVKTLGAPIDTRLHAYNSGGNFSGSPTSDIRALAIKEKREDLKDIDWEKEQKEAFEDSQKVAQRQADDISKLRVLGDKEYKPDGPFSKIMNGLWDGLKGLFPSLPGWLGGPSTTGSSPAVSTGNISADEQQFRQSQEVTPGSATGGQPKMIQSHVSASMRQAGAPVTSFSGGGGAIDQLSGLKYSQKDEDKSQGAIDCSLLTTKVYAAAGIKGIGGSAQQQYEQTLKNGVSITEYSSLKPGDLMFFHSDDITNGTNGKPGTGRKITHVGIFLGKDKNGVEQIFHASGGKKPSGVYPITKAQKTKPYFVGGGRSSDPEGSKKVVATLLGNQQKGSNLATKGEENAVPSSALPKSESTESTSPSGLSTAMPSRPFASERKSATDMIAKTETQTSTNEDKAAKDAMDKGIALRNETEQQLIRKQQHAEEEAKNLAMMGSVSALPTTTQSSTSYPTADTVNKDDTKLAIQTPVAAPKGSGFFASLGDTFSSLYDGIKSNTNSIYSNLSDTATNVYSSAMSGYDNVSSGIRTSFGYGDTPRSNVDSQLALAKRVNDNGPPVTRATLEPTYQDSPNNMVANAMPQQRTAYSSNMEQPRLTTDGIFLVDDAGLNLIILGVV